MKHGLMHNLPPKQEKPSAWYGPDMNSRKKDWMFELSHLSVSELEAAAETFLTSEKEIGIMKQSDFNLPTLSNT